MNQYYTFQFFLICLVFITLVYGRALYYDDLIDDNTEISSGEDEEQQDLRSKLSDMINEEENDNDLNTKDSLSYDSFEERMFHERSIFSTSRPTHTISPHTRQAILDILQKAFDEGWRPNLKHYIPATRFGRH